MGSSEPGPVSPRSWLEGIYNYASKGIKPGKLFLGLPAYGWNWRIHDTPANMDMVNRGVSNTYYAARLWMQGGYNFTNDGPPQPMIPFVSYWDDYDKVPSAVRSEVDNDRLAQRNNRVRIGMEFVQDALNAGLLGHAADAI